MSTSEQQNNPWSMQWVESRIPRDEACEHDRWPVFTLAAYQACKYKTKYNYPRSEGKSAVVRLL